MDSVHGGSTLSGSGPFITTTTVTTILDFNPASMSRAMRSSGSERNHYFGDKKYGTFSRNEMDVLINSWNTLKRRGDFAPKVFVR
jgi:hypothetical protein